MKNEERGNGFGTLVAFLFGALGGVCLSLILAPNPGRETRKRIRDASAEAKEMTVEVAHKATETAKESVQELFDQGKERLHDTTRTVQAAVDAGRRAFAEKRAQVADEVSEATINSDNDDDSDEGVAGTPNEQPSS